MGVANSFLGVASGIQGVGEIAGGFQQAGAIKAQGQYEQNQMNFNAQIAEIQAQDARARGKKAEVQIKRQANQVRGAQRAAAAASGVVVDDGSAAELQADTAMLSAEDASAVRSNAWREAWGYQVQASDYRTQGEMARLAAKNRAGNTIITGLNRGAGYFSKAAEYGVKAYGDRKKYDNPDDWK